MIRSTDRLLYGQRSTPQHRASFRREPHTDDDGWDDPYRAANRREIILCHYCGYGPSKIPADGMCPKCGRCAWEFSVVSQRLIPTPDDV